MQSHPSNQNEHQGVSVIFIRENNSFVVAIVGKEKHSATIPFGTRPLYHAVALVRNVTYDDAKSLVRNFLEEDLLDKEEESPDEPRELKLRKLTVQLHQNEIKRLVERCLEDAITYCYYSLKHAGFDRKIGQGLVITGQLSGFAGLRIFAERVTGLPCDVCVEDGF